MIELHLFQDEQNREDIVFRDHKGTTHVLKEQEGLFAWHVINGGNPALYGLLSSPVFTSRRSAEAYPHNTNTELLTAYERAKQKDFFTPCALDSSAPVSRVSVSPSELQRFGVPKESVKPVFMACVNLLNSSPLFKRKSVSLQRYTPRFTDSPGDPLHDTNELHLEMRPIT